MTCKQLLPNFRKMLLTTVCLCGGAALAADMPSYPTPDQPTDPNACVAPDINSINIDQSLVVHDQASIGTGFEFSKTIGAVLKSANLPDDQASKEAFVKTLLNSFDDEEAENNGLRMRIDRRNVEFALQAKDLLDPTHATGLVPTGLFNRLDLAPESFADCGEHRIVYSFKKEEGFPNRFFLIFEAKLPNPDAASKSAGQKADPKACIDVAKFWTGLTGLSPAERNSRLQQFYYSGLPGSTGPVVSANNYGDLLGQVRSNQFKEMPWMLREWRVQTNSSTGNIAFKVDTVKSNPLAELYNANSNGALEPAEQETRRQLFQSELLAKYVQELVDADKKSGGNAEAVINGFGITSDISQFNEFQSESQNGTDVPNPDAALQTAIAAAIPNGGGANVSAEQMVNRVNAITCQGCHQTAPGSVVGKDGGGADIVWPGTLGFVHISEPNGQPSSELSEALTARFLPSRRKNLAAGHCINPDDVAPLPGNAANTTVSDLSASIAIVRGAEASPPPDLAQKISEGRAAIRAASEGEPGFFVRARRPH